MRARDNPFATAHLERLAFRFPPGQDWDTFVARLKAAGYRGTLVGPEGSGKTTLLEQLGGRLRDLGFKPLVIRLDSETPGPSAETWRTLAESVDPRTVVLLDGAERLNRRHWRRLERATAGAGGFIVTAHRPTRLPTLLECCTSPRLLHELVDELLGAHRPTEPEPFDAVFERQGGNLRLALLEFYDRYANRVIVAAP